jgi:pyruvate,water dikinase
MTFVRRLEDIRIGDKGWAGDKAACLGELIHAGFDVPPGRVIGPDAYRVTLAENHIDTRITQRLADTEIDDPVELEAAAEEIRSWIERATLGQDLTQEITTAVAELKGAPDTPPQTGYAVRVSRLVEDVVNPRASGLAQAYLGVMGEQAILDHVRQGWATLWTSRAIYYRHRKKIDQKQIALAVVLQPMIAAEAAGVMFTGNPMTLATDEILIDATWGLGEAIIAARWKPDHFVLSKAELEIREREIGDKNVMEIVAPEGGLETVIVPPEKQANTSIDDRQIAILAEIGKRVESLFKQAQDIEWCRVKDRMILLQTRPLGRHVNT